MALAPISPKRKLVELQQCKGEAPEESHITPKKRKVTDYQPNKDEVAEDRDRPSSKRKFADLQQNKNQAPDDEDCIPEKEKLCDATTVQRDLQILPPAVLDWLERINEQLNSNERRRLCQLLQGQNVSQEEAEVTSRLDSKLRAKICEFLEQDSPSTKPLHNQGSCETPANKRKVEPSSEPQVGEKKRKPIEEPPKKPTSNPETQSKRDVSSRANIKGEPSAQDRLKTQPKCDVSPRGNRKGESKAQDRTTPIKYKLGNIIGQGSFGKVFKAEAVQTGKIVAIKAIKQDASGALPEMIEREIMLLKSLHHPNVLGLVKSYKATHMGKPHTILVLPYMDNDLAKLMRHPRYSPTLPQIRSYMKQLLEGVRYFHASKVFHRDLKPANILVNDRGVLQIADLGLARLYEGGVPRAGHGNGEATRDYTESVVTLGYRSPELLMGLTRYTPAVDMWSVGCIFAEMVSKEGPLFRGNTELDQMQNMFSIVGSPTDTNMPGWNRLPEFRVVKRFPKVRNNGLAKMFGYCGPEFTSLLEQLLKLDWRQRINAIDALDHEYFKPTPRPRTQKYTRPPRSRNVARARSQNCRLTPP